MLLESTTLGCTVPTARDLTGVRALPSVGAHVRLELTAHFCAVATARDLTRVAALTRVR